MAKDNSAIKWFPFTDYDFYAYLASGFVLLFFLDVFLNHSNLLTKVNWTFIQIVLSVSTAYILGQIVAIPSSIFFEHFFIGKVLSHPKEILIGTRSPNFVERLINTLFIGRYYAPLSQSTRDTLIEKASVITKAKEIKNDPETIFQIGYSTARKSEDIADRLDGFRNQYGFARNISFVILIGIIIFIIQSIRYHNLSDQFGILVFLVIIFIGMLARFLKFYSAFNSEVLRALAYN